MMIDTPYRLCLLRIMVPNAQAWFYFISKVSSAMEDAAGVELSVTLNVNLVFGSATFGVPLMVPVASSNFRDAGNAGLTDHFNGATPPLACSVSWYGVPTLPSGNVVVMIFTVIEISPMCLEVKQGQRCDN